MKLIKLLLCSLLIAEQVVFPFGSFAAEKSFMDDLNGPMVDEPASASAASSVPQAAVPGTPVQIGGKTQKESPLYEGKDASDPLNRMVGPIRLTNTPLTQVLDVISAQSGVTFMLADNVENKRTTIFMRKTSVRDALELILKMRSLTYQRIGNSGYTYIVTKPALQTPNLVTKIYTLNYIPLASDVSGRGTNTMISTRGGNMDGSGGGGMSMPSGGGGGESGMPTAIPEGIPPIVPVLQSVLSNEFGKVQTDVRLNALIVTDVPESFPQVEQIISELDKKAPQILIESQIVEINTERLNELGIEWGGTKGEMAYYMGGAHATDALLRPGYFSGNQWKKFFGNSYTKDATAVTVPDAVGSVELAENGLMHGVFSLTQLTAQFRALISRSEARYLGKPKIIAVNNSTATIKAIEDPALAQEGSSTAASGVTTDGGYQRASDTGATVGLEMVVTPQINKDGYITLGVKVSYGTIVASAIANDVYNPATREAQTNVRVKNGQTVVIGGLLKSEESKTVRKVPLLGYIPIIGWIFTSVSSNRKNTDLVVFITPTILVD